MSGFFFLAEPYWQAIAAARSELEELTQHAPDDQSAKDFIWQI
jgi:hypothetical protein